ncbi:MAG: N-formylglutamate amidohydrolase [Gammaproteobacteria bacterium]
MAPFEALNETAASPLVLLCEHASNHVPEHYNGLGLPESELERHIAWDIGAAKVTRSLSRLLNAPAFLGTFSRLLIDLNRPLHVPESIVARSEATDIPGNVGLSDDERQRRTQTMFRPFHDRVEQHLERRQRAGLPVVIVAVHSFTPVYHGVARPWHAGVLFGSGEALAKTIIQRLRTGDASLVVDANVPYNVGPDDEYGLLVYGDNRGNPAILIEMRQDLIAADAGAEEWAHRLAAALQLPF